MKKHLIWAVLAATTTVGIAALALSVIPSAESPVVPSEDDQSGPLPIYVSFASHNEDEYHPAYPNYLEDEETFWRHRSELLAYATMLASHGVKYSYQTDWNFLLAVEAFDEGDATTNGKNILRYIHEDLGADIDPHSHENGGYNFVDVAYLISKIGVPPTGVVGGFIAGPSSEDSQLSYFWNLTNGKMYPDATWKPTILWGGGTAQHQDESDYWISGVWNPKDAERFDEHDPSAPLPVVGRYRSTWEGLDDLLQKRHDGTLEDDGFYTITIMLNQDEMTAAARDEDERRILSYEDEVANGEIIYATITETYAAWAATQQGEPTILHYDGAESGLAAGCGNGACSIIERKSKTCPEDCLLP